MSFTTGRLILSSPVSAPLAKTLSPAVISHEYVVTESTPPLDVVKSTTAVSPLHISKESTESTWPVGFTVIVNSIEDPSQVKDGSVSSLLGVTVTIATIGSFVLLSASNNGIFPIPVKDCVPISVSIDHE